MESSNKRITMEGSKLHSNTVVSWFYDVDLLIEILSRLPSKSLMRFKSVCKSWQTLITSRYFCLLWQQRHHHQAPGLILNSVMDNRNHVRITLSGVTQFELPRIGSDYVIQSYNGFLLLEKFGSDGSFLVCNPTTREVIILSSRIDDCKLHARHCRCIVTSPALAFNSYSDVRVVGLAQRPVSKPERGFVYQVCVAVNEGGWRCVSKKFISRHTMCEAVRWRDFIVWLATTNTLFYDLKEELLREDAPHPSILGVYRFGESGGNLHLVYFEQTSLMINEMSQDLSCWIVKHKVELSQIEASLFQSVGWVSGDGRVEVHSVIEDKEKDSKLLALSWKDHLVLFRVRDHKSWKICEWKFNSRGLFVEGYIFNQVITQHFESLCRFYEQ